jgi:hypothetical protein
MDRDIVPTKQVAAQARSRDKHYLIHLITNGKWHANSELRRHTTAGAAKLATVESTFCVVRSTTLTTIPTAHVVGAKVSEPQLTAKSTKIGRIERRLQKTTLRRRRMLGINSGAKPGLLISISYAI